MNYYSSFMNRAKIGNKFQSLFNIQTKKYAKEGMTDLKKAFKNGLNSLIR